MSGILKEGEQLWNLGFAILWIKPKSKAPVRSKWSSGPRESWSELRSSYRPGYNIGVRLGTPSRVGNGTLSILDVDVKSTDEKHQKEAVEAVKMLFPEIKTQDLPYVLSGRGNGSGHLYLITQSVMRPQLLMRSPDRVRVLMPSSPSSNASKAELPEEDINEGWRMRPAWEVSIMGEGQQALLPPSIHPDTGKVYRWDRPFKIFDAVRLENIPSRVEAKEKITSSKSDWSPALETEVDGLLKLLPENLQNTIREGGSNPDRSGALFGVSIALVKEGWSTHEIQSLLTDRRYELGRVAYDHTKSSSRTRAADWVFNYTLAKAKKEAFDTKLFEREVERIPLSDEAAEAQALEVVHHDWRTQIHRNGEKGENPGAPKKTLKNLILILENDVGGNVFRRDLFANNRDSYGVETPWGGRRDAVVNDDDLLQMKTWFADRFRFEPDKWLILEAITVIALRNKFHPVRDYILGLEWDGKIRLDSWLKQYLRARGPDPYLKDVGRKFLVAMVARVFQPGIKFDHIPILEGKQGKGKSTAARILASDPWFMDNLPDLKSADARLALQGKWLVEMGELSELKRNEVEIIKAYVTSQTDNVRAPYGLKAREIPRQSVFMGSTNPGDYLKDKTGNRRFWPIEMGTCDLDGLRGARDQLFAEAYFIWENLDEKLWLENPESLHQAEAIQEGKVGDDFESYLEDIFDDFLGAENAKKIDEKFNFSRFKIKDLFAGPAPVFTQNPDKINVLISRILKRKGFIRRKLGKGRFWTRINN